MCFVWFSEKKEQQQLFRKPLPVALWWTGSACFQWGGDWVLMLFGWISYSKVIVKHIKKGMNEWNLTTKRFKKRNNVAKTYEKRNIRHGGKKKTAHIAALCEKHSPNCCTPCCWSMSWRSSCYKTNDLHVPNVRSDTVFTATCFGGRQSFSWTHSQRHYCVSLYVLCVQVVGFIIWITFISHCMEWRQTSKYVVKTCVL